MSRGKGSNIGQALEAVAGRLDRRSGGALTQLKVMKAWSAVAGEQVLGHTTGAHLRKGELVVYVDSPVWATELSALSEQYRRAIKEYASDISVSTVRFAVSKKASDQVRLAQAERDSLSERNAEAVPSIPLSEQEMAQVRASAEAIPDDGLREAVIRATVADLEWKKGIAKAKRRQGPREGA